MNDFQTKYKKIKKGIKKNYREFYAFKNKLYPKFVFNNLDTIKDEIPIFTLHSVNPVKFENQLAYLVENGYKTLNADELYQSLLGNIPVTERTIVLTFDDGWKNLYTTAYPLLKKYNFKAVCFLITDLIEESDFTNKSVDKKSSYYPDSAKMCNWDEITEMHNSGIIDFQSHSKNHYLISTSSKIIDFVYPNFDTYSLNIDIPLYKKNGLDDFSRNVQLGTPIYEHDSRFSGKKRYFDNEELRLLCNNFVAQNGNSDFFLKSDWRKQISNIVENYKSKNDKLGFYEKESELHENIFKEMKESKIAIEKKLNKKVDHFCYPWWVGSEVALEISKESGYLSNFWGTILGKRTNKKGDDPFRIVRLLSDDFIFNLPGKNRKTFLETNLKKILFELNISKQ